MAAKPYRRFDFGLSVFFCCYSTWSESANCEQQRATYFALIDSRRRKLQLAHYVMTQRNYHSSIEAYSRLKKIGAGQLAMKDRWGLHRFSLFRVIVRVEGSVLRRICLSTSASSDGPATCREDPSSGRSSRLTSSEYSAGIPSFQAVLGWLARTGSKATRRDWVSKLAVLWSWSEPGNYAGSLQNGGDPHSYQV